MVFAQAVLEAVLAVAAGAADADVREGVDVGLAGWMRALRCGEEGWFGGAGARCGFSPASGCPGAGVRAGVGGLGAVVEAVGSVAGLAAEGEEVELVAVGVLAVGADGFDFFVHGGEGLGVGCGGGLGGGGRHGSGLWLGL